MMAQQRHCQPKLFYGGINLESRVGPDHPLRRVAETVDFSFVRQEVATCYGVNGNVSVDPTIILKLMFLLFYENVKSERELLRQLPLRLDWLWFCEYDIDDETPHHSILSKARRRWGADAFERFFQQILEQCLAAGLIDGSVVHIDSSLIQANAAKDKLRPELRVLTRQVCQKLEDSPPPAEPAASPRDDDPDKPLHRRVSPVDPDARLVQKYGQNTLGYKDHRVVDDRRGIVTATITTAANVNDEKRLEEAIESHEANTGAKVKTAVADKAYGIGENYQYLYEREITACINHKRYKKSQDDAFTSDQFRYDAVADCYWCPAGYALKRKYTRAAEKMVIYQIDRQTCESCPYGERCATGKKHGRQIQRSRYAEYYEWADGCLSAKERKRLLSRRKAKAEGSFADAANNHGYKRSRWRGLTMATIQNLMIAAVQNLRKLLRYCRRKASCGVIATVVPVLSRPLISLFWLWQRLRGSFLAILSKYLLLKEQNIECST